MKHLYLYMVLLATLLFVGCGSVGSSADVKREEVREPEVVMRYGVNVEGYELRCCTLRKSETMSDIMKQYGRSATDVHRVERASVDVFPLRKMRVGNDYTIFLKSDSLGRSRVEYVAYEIDKFQYVLFVMCGDSIGVQRGSKPVKIVQQSRSVKIESSLMGAIKSSSLPYELGVDIGNIFQWSVDLFSLRRGDSFRVIYDEEFVDDSVSIGIGRIKGAAFYHNNKLNYAIPFEQDGKIQYWDQDGGSLRMQMLKSPLRYSRSNSHQSSVRSSQRDGRSSNMEVYYAAPTGTPIHSVGDGVVSFVGQEEIDGKTVKIRHSNGVESGYFHLSRYARGLIIGSKISQGEVIGYVGSSGDSQEPHLDYRVWIGGVEVDPLSLPPRSLEPIRESNKEAFLRERDRVVAELDEI